jgi:hypothetical protein
LANVRAANAQADADAKSLRLSLDTKATVLLGEYSRRGKARGQKPVAAQDHDMAPDKEKLIPVGILEVGSAQLDLCFATSPAKTSDLLIDCLENWWRRRGPTYQGVEELVLNVDNGPESNRRRTQFLSRLADFADKSGLRLRLVYYPPDHRKYNPIERCWAVLEKHWNGAFAQGCANRAALGQNDDLERRRPIGEAHAQNLPQGPAIGGSRQAQTGGAFATPPGSALVGHSHRT